MGLALGLLALAGVLSRGQTMSPERFQEDQWGWQRSRHRDVGVYFGTFDPIHENHLGLASFAPHGLRDRRVKALRCDRGLVDRVYFVVNGTRAKLVHGLVMLRRQPLEASGAVLGVAGSSRPGSAL